MKTIHKIYRQLNVSKITEMKIYIITRVNISATLDFIKRGMTHQLPEEIQDDNKSIIPVRWIREVEERVLVCSLTSYINRTVIKLMEISYEEVNRKIIRWNMNY